MGNKLTVEACFYFIQLWNNHHPAETVPPGSKRKYQSVIRNRHLKSAIKQYFMRYNNKKDEFQQLLDMKNYKNRDLLSCFCLIRKKWSYYQFRSGKLIGFYFVFGV